MNKNQKMIFKGYLLFFLGIVLFLLSIILMIIYANVLRNPFGDFPIYIIFCLAIVGYSISISSSKYNIMLITNFKTFSAFSGSSMLNVVRGYSDQAFNGKSDSLIKIKNMLI